MDPCTFQLIDGDRHFQVDRLNSFVVKTKFSDHGNSYSVVSVLGPQSSGKSTLLNCLFGTNFEVMGTFGGEFQTTQGIWMARGCDIQPFTIVMDMEGTDGSVKEGDTTFDKQSALFALEISDVLMINMWWKDVGLHEAGYRELLKTVFKFMVQLFKPRKTTLLFVLRDKGTKIPFEKIETYLNRDIEKIWGGVPKPEAQINTPLNEFFKVEIIALSSYDHMEDQFKQEVDKLRQRFFSSASTSQGGQVAADRRVVSASDFSDHAQKMWNLITQIRDLNISSIQEMVSIIRCDEISKQKLDALSAAQVDKGILMGPLGVAEKFCSIMKTCLSEYDEETKYYDEGIRSAKREYLVSRALEVLQMRLSTSSATSEELKLALAGASSAAQVAAALGNLVANSLAIFGGLN
ncbi:protein ROOT HAIR DEFECTIVE 3 homolog 2-like [Mangifera indica]|uniref:protein ROOT HAIR DEFECTIVE 3 homolog 2-like n=1 Tax=Mangifera indica TaxID=29780 RepID=UPI001CFB5593|nr:protein ROOT HAIR DEFECTIVE 3 homolog 2-like [Mangifera indica]